MVDTELVPLEGSHDALFGRVAPTVAALATGSALGWFFKLELLRLLVDPWRDSRRILEWQSFRRASSQLVPGSSQRRWACCWPCRG